MQCNAMQIQQNCNDAMHSEAKCKCYSIQLTASFLSQTKKRKYCNKRFNSRKLFLRMPMRKLFSYRLPFRTNRSNCQLLFFRISSMDKWEVCNRVEKLNPSSLQISYHFCVVRNSISITILL